MGLKAGVARTLLTPFWGVELTGWGYYLERTWQTVHDDLHATALVLDNGETTLAVVSLDLMVISNAFTRQVREQVRAETGIPETHMMVACTHTHNAPASGGLLGVGEVDPFYEDWAARQAATAIILAWQNREPADLCVAGVNLPRQTFNRTRENGPVDPRLTTLRVNRANGSPLAMMVNFQAHPTVQTNLQPRAVSRDVPGEICDCLERALPGATALYLQGPCGDVNYLRRFSTTPELSREPGRITAGAALASLADAERIDEPRLSAVCQMVSLPTRRWTREEIDHDRVEAQRRLQDNDVTGWKETIGRVMTNRPEEMVARHGGDERKAVEAMCRFNLAWTYEMLKDWDTRPETLTTEVQAFRIGELGIVANSSEFFSSLALDVRNQAGLDHLMISCYTNGRIGYLPDAHDIARKTYAAYQSPKYCNQFPFTNESGPAMCEAMLKLLRGERGA
jgi:hypothetical protein